ncbi:hypothetical protein ACSBR1_023489 [Camellia fascicularis]
MALTNLQQKEKALAVVLPPGGTPTIKTLVPYPLISDSDFFGDNLGFAKIISASRPGHMAPRLTHRRHLATCWYSENISPQVLSWFFYFVIMYYSGTYSGRKSDVAWHIAMILLNPCLILIDHGHFQYNCISLGLLVGAVAPILSNKDLLACVLFCLALNHK